MSFPAKLGDAYSKSLDWHSKVALSDHTLDKSNLDLCKSWLSECRLSHRKCKPANTPRQLPLRLLELKDTKSGLEIKLRMTEDIEGEADYMTLSHIWGSLAGSKLTKEALSHFQTSVPLQDLSATFRDAMRITMDLGCHYLWIDALCIIQDDKEDWAAEGVRMSSIYGYSLLNIAASEAIEGTRGCNFSRDPDLVRPVKIDTASKTLLLTPNVSIYDELVNSSPLATRAWIFQERYLAPRTVYFGKEQIVWECNTINSCETFPHGIPSKLRGSKNTWARQHDETSSENAYSQWRGIAESYSKGELTYNSDKIVALSGIARRFAEDHDIPSQEYLAGMWRRYLLRSLAWRAVSGGEPGGEYIAPTWSWTAVIGQISMIEYSKDLEPEWDVRVRDATVSVAGDQFGPVVDGNLLLECGPLVQVELDSKWLSGKASFDFDEPVEGLKGENSKLFLLSLGKVTGYVDGWKYLVLHKVEGKELRRVGVGELASWIAMGDGVAAQEEQAANARSEFLDAQQDEKCCAALDVYHDVLKSDATGPRYVVNIV